MKRRVFLNKPGYHSVGAILARCENNGYELVMSDCNHTVSFSIDAYDVPGRENTLYKVDTMIRVLTEFREALAKNFAKK